MTPSLFDLPLRLGDACALASVLIETLGAQPKPVSDDQRARVAARAGSLKPETLRALPASLERDPVHPSAYYICVDGIDGQPLLLRVAPASAPSSGLFPKAILIGRTRIGTLETVLNAVPFGPADRERTRVFAENVNRAFLSRPSGSKAVIRVSGSAPGETLSHAFEAFRKLLRSTGRNMAAFSGTPDFTSTVTWAAIRTGWREGYSIESQNSPLIVNRDVELNAGMSREEIFGLIEG